MVSNLLSDIIDFELTSVENQRKLSFTSCDPRGKAILSEFKELIKKYA